VVKKKSRASASRAKGAKKGATKGAKKSAVKRAKTRAKATLAGPELREGLDVKKLRLDLQKAIDTLQRRIEQGDKTGGLPETAELFMHCVDGIERIVCVGADGPCGEDMFIGS
jgi:hypothetical protein